VFLSPLQILSALPLPPKPKIGDFGAGKGDYTMLLAKKLGSEAVIYAFDAFHPALDSLHKEGKRHLPRIHALHADLNRHIPLSSGLLNAAIVSNTLHQLQDRECFASEIARVMAHNGKVLVIDWAGSFKNMGPIESNVLSPGEAAALFKNAGFSIGEMISAGTHHFAFVATRT
jgi:ubiquinone/menaquinone biosynthesis C-methylase UbiE